MFPRPFVEVVTAVARGAVECLFHYVDQWSWLGADAHMSVWCAFPAAFRTRATTSLIHVERVTTSALSIIQSPKRRIMIVVMHVMCSVFDGIVFETRSTNLVIMLGT